MVKVIVLKYAVDQAVNEYYLCNGSLWFLLQ